jgi:hypothetical protein
MGIEEIQYAVVAVTVKSMFGVSHEQATLDVEVGGLGTLQPNAVFPFLKPWIIN